MTGQHKLEFIPNPAKEAEGMGHPGIEHFRGAPYAGTARECGQNSADASKSKPVGIDFDHLEIPASDLPALKEYKAVVSLCLKKALKAGDSKGIPFFKHAKDVLNREKIHILSISDSNTIGLSGPSEEGTPFHSLLKGSGVSVKETVTAGGSFGIGKFAAFAISELQTVFYSTVYEDKMSGEKTFLAQGRSILISHQDEKGEPKRSFGYWGNDDFEPVNDTGSVPEWLKRSEMGTSLHVIGFKVSNDWQYRMAASLLTNFFPAILRDEMKFSLNKGEININSKTVSELFNNPEIKKAAEESNKAEDLELSRNLLECLTSAEAVEEKMEIKGLGNVSVRILLREGLKKSVVIIRNGMVITDSLKNFGDSFRQFPMYSDFVALVEPLDDEGSSLIRTLENPSHDELSSERIMDDKMQQHAYRVMKKLAKKIRETIRKEARTEPEDEVAIEELSEFFADSSNSEALPDPGAETNPETIIYIPLKKPKKKEKPPPVVLVEEGEEGGAGGENESEGGGGDGQGEGKGEGTGGKGKKKFALPLQIQEMRNRFILGGGSYKRRIFFTSEDTCRAHLIISASGLSDKEDLVVIRSDEGQIEKGRIVIDLQAGKRKKIDIEFAEEYEGPIELLAVKPLEGADDENR